MDINPVAQGAALLGSLVLGVALGLVYDGFRIARRTLPSKVLTAALDLLFWAVCFAGYFFYSLTSSGGEVRWDLLCGAAAGGGVYFLTLSPVVLRLAAFFIRFFKTAISFLFLPIRLFCSWMKKIQKKLKNYFIFRRKWYRIDVGIMEMNSMSDYVRTGGENCEAETSINHHETRGFSGVLLSHRHFFVPAERNRSLSGRRADAGAAGRTTSDEQ